MKIIYLIIYKNLHINQNNFNDIKDLIYYCHCSSYIPFLSGYYYKYNNSKYVDGALIHKTIINNSDTLNINYNPYFTTYIDYNISNKLYQEGWNDTRDNFTSILNIYSYIFYVHFLLLIIFYYNHLLTIIFF